MQTRQLALLGTVMALGTGCYHAIIETGATPAPTTIEKPWASGWLAGLVPPAPIETQGKCPDGVAKVETQQSFTNGLVALLTFGIYTPMSIKVTCATAPAASGSE